MKHLRMTLIALALLTAGLVTRNSAQAQYPDTFAFVEVTDPLSGINPTYPLIPRPLPAVGDTFWDNRFNTMQVRATATNGIQGRHEYSRFDPFNSAKSMIILDPGGPWGVYRTQSYPYNQPSNLVRTVSLSEPRWDPADSSLIWGVQGFTIRTVNVVTGQETVVKDFENDPVMGPVINTSPVYRITMKDEGESSRDKRYWAFMLQGDGSAGYQPLYVFTYDRVLDTVPGVTALAPEEQALDWVGMSQLGGHALIGGLSYNGGRMAGLTMADRSLTRFHRLDYTVAHADVGIDRSGGEVVVMQNTRTDYIDLIPIDTLTQPILVSGGSYAGTNRTPLVRLFYSSGSPHGLQSGVHVSCNVPGYALISTTFGPGDPEQNWLDRSIILAKLDPQDPRAFYLSKLYNTTDEYWEETHGTISNDGSVVVWADNWGQNVGQEQMSLTQLFMPPEWQQLTGAAGGPEDAGGESGLQLFAYPNPCRGMVNITYALPRAADVKLKMYNLAGQLVRTLKNGRCGSGRHLAVWDLKDDAGRRLAGGIYVFRLEAGSQNRAGRIMVLR